jgi:raffinose/stachyose/melibiose transport system substrate-binding protein
MLGNQDSWVMQQCLFSLIAGRFCGEGWEQRILAGEAKFTDQDFLGALEFIRTLYADGVISRNSLLIDYRDAAAQFAENKAAYLIDGDWRSSLLGQEPIQAAVFPEIGGTRLKDSTSLIPGAGWGINAAIPENSPEEKAAWRLAQWLSGAEVQTFLLGNGGIRIPSRADINEAALDLQPLQKAVAALCRNYPTGTAVIDRVFPSNVYTPINDGLQEIGMGTRTPLDVARSIQRAFDAWAQ